MSALSSARRYSRLFFSISRCRFLILDAILQCFLFYHGVAWFLLEGQVSEHWPVILSVFTFVNFEISLTMTLLGPCNHRVKTRAALIFLNIFYTFCRFIGWVILFFAKLNPSQISFSVDELSWELFLVFSISTFCTIGIIGKTPHLRDPFSRL